MRSELSKKMSSPDSFAAVHLPGTSARICSGETGFVGSAILLLLGLRVRGGVAKLVEGAVSIGSMTARPRPSRDWGRLPVEVPGVEAGT